MADDAHARRGEFVERRRRAVGYRGALASMGRRRRRVVEAIYDGSPARLQAFLMARTGRTTERMSRRFR